MAVQIKHLLKQYDLRHTSCRADTLKAFLGSPFALSNADIEQAVGKEYDRVTVYRTLKTFLEKGVIHKVLDDSSTLKYALCAHTCNEASHNHEHVHFKCEACGNTTCLENVQIPALKLPQGYQVHETNLLIQGQCPNCR